MNNSQDFLLQIISLLKKKFILIGGGALICGILAAIISLILPEAYEAQSTLLIMPQKFQEDIQQQQQSYTPITYQNLLMSKDMAKQIINRLKLKNVKIEQLMESLKTEVVMEERGLNQRSYSPIIKLVARGKTPQQAALIANTWAELFVEQNGMLTSRESELSYDFLTSQFSQTTTALQDAESQMKALRDSTKLEMVKSEMSNKLSKLEGYRANFTDIKYDLDTKTAQLTQLKKKINAQEENGAWIGIIRAENPADEFSQQTARLAKIPIDPSSLFLRNEVLEAKWNFISAQENLRMFLENNKIEMIRNMFQQRNKELVDAQIELARDDVRLVSLDSSLRVLQGQLAKIDKYIVLKKGMTDDALWSKYASGTTSAKEADDIARMKIETQEINPVYQGMVKQTVDLEVEFNTLKPKRDSLRDKIIATDKTVKELDTQLNNIEIKEKRLENQYAVASTNYKQIQNQYTDLKNELLSTQINVDSIQGKLTETMKAVQNLNDSVQGLLATSYEGELQEDQLSRNITTFRSTFDMLAKEVENAKIAKANEISDLKIASRAVEPQQRISPKRTLMTLTAFIAGFLVTFFFCLIQEFLLTPALKENK
jgi:uncharacterized protein involved in exopolysaccharide biosynthesis